MKLHKIDLRKRCGEDGCEHPDINTRSSYLLKIAHHGFAAGKFDREWFGLTMDVGTHWVQLDDRDIEAIWRITP